MAGAWPLALGAGLLTAGRFAADQNGDPVVSPGLAGFLVTFALALATVFLIRSMVKHLRKVRYGPEPEDRQGSVTSGTAEPDDQPPRSPGNGPDAA